MRSWWERAIFAGSVYNQQRKSLTIWQNAAGTWVGLRSFSWLQGKRESLPQSSALGSQATPGKNSSDVFVPALTMTEPRR